MKEGKLRPIMVTSRTRLAAYPDVPTVDEAGLPGFYVAAWVGLFGPKGLPADIVRTLETTLEKIWKSEEFQNGMRQRNFGTKWLNGADTLAFMQQHEKSLSETMKALGLAK